MKYTAFGKTSWQVSLLGLGTWALGGPGWAYGWGPQDDEVSLKVMEKAVAMGVNWFDTAPAYGLGHAEELIGKFLKKTKKEIYIFTKAGLVWDDQGRIKGWLEPQSIKKECEASLKRLGVACIDLYQIHWPIPEEQIDDAWEAFLQLQEEGKVCYIGVCNFQVHHLKRLKPLPVSLQPPYSLLERSIEKEILPYAIQKNLAIIPYSPLQKGILTEKFSRKFVASLPSEDHRKTRDPFFKEPQLSDVLKKVARWKKEAHAQGLTLAQFALKWVLSQKGITAVIAGARTPEQLSELLSWL